MLNVQRYVNIIFAVLAALLFVYAARLYVLNDIKDLRQTMEAQGQTIQGLRGDIDQIVNFVNQQSREQAEP